MKIVLLLLLALPLFGKQSERYYQEKFAREIGGQVEVVMKDGTRCDILTATHAIEVDFARKWAEAIGQSLNYAMHTGKNFDNGEKGGIDAKFLAFNRWWAESDMDAEDLSKAALTAIDDWLDEEIVGFEPEEG